jgi:excisionase family DNA binding protein
MMRVHPPVDPDTVAYDVNSAARVIGCGRNKIYDEIAAGRLEARKVGRRTIIPRAAILAWLDALPRLITAA